MKKTPVNVGEVVDLRLSVGPNNQRLRCPACVKYLANRPGALTCHCGVVYEPVGGVYKVASV